jgi:phosphatidylserine synthase
VPLFASTITVENLLTFVSIVVGFFSLYQSMTRRLDKLEMRTAMMWKHFCDALGIPYDGQG